MLSIYTAVMYGPDRGFHDLGAKYWAHSVRESVLFRSLMTHNGTICNYGA